MDKRHKDILRPLVADLRRTLAGTADGARRGDLDRELGRLGIAPDGTIEPFDTLPDPTPAERQARRVAEAELGLGLGPGPAAGRAAARAAFVERAAYGWIDRLLTLRVLEARGLIDETLRSNPAYDGLSEALYVLRQDQPARAAGSDGGWWAVVEDACAAQAATLPGIFALSATAPASPDHTLFDPAVALRPSAAALLSCVARLGGAPSSTASARVSKGRAEAAEAALAELDAAFADPDAIGWAYQFYQEEAKAQTYLRLKGGKGKKVTTRDEIAAVTQLFTEPYMVQWLLQNSLGRGYHEMYPHSALPTAWAYYIHPGSAAHERPGSAGVSPVPGPRWHEPVTDGDAPSPPGWSPSLPPAPGTGETPALPGTGETPALPGRSWAAPDLAGLTVLDPCCGSGHFLREAFDMLAAMYREQQPDLPAAEIADRILAHHLYGIDLDPRAAQLAAFTLYLRAWELVRAERRAARLPRPGSYRPAAMNLATTPERVVPGALERHLRRHPGDRALEPLLKGVFAALERADVLGSLLRPREHLAPAIAELRRPHTPRLQDDPEAAELQRVIETLAQTNPAELEGLLLDRVAASFAADARGADDVAAALFGRAAERGVRLLQLLDRQYAVVTNPPYMGSASMDKPLRAYVEAHYPSGKRDLYAALMLRCLQLSCTDGRVAMVVKQGWLTDHDFADFRAIPKDELAKAREENKFTGILRETKLDLLVQLGSGAFEEITGEVVKAALFTLRVAAPLPTQTLHAMDLSGLKSVEERVQLLSQSSTARLRNLTFHTAVSTFLQIDSSPIIYSLPHVFQQLFLDIDSLGRGRTPLLSVRDGMNTGNNDRFVRYAWEGYGSRWVTYSKGGGYNKWRGFEYFIVDWGNLGERIAGAQLSGTRLQNLDTFFVSGLCYSLISQGALGVRQTYGCAYDGGGLSIQSSNNVRLSILATLNSRIATYFARMLSQDIKFRGGYVERIPRPHELCGIDTAVVEQVVKLKQRELEHDVIEREFQDTNTLTDDNALIAVRHTLEGRLESQVFAAYRVDDEATAMVVARVGVPAGWYPLVPGYDSVERLTLYLESEEVAASLIIALERHQRVDLHDVTLAVCRRERSAGLHDRGPLSRWGVPPMVTRDRRVVAGRTRPQIITANSGHRLTPP